ncbi:MAG TPA: phenylalanine--tRNA ligase subunit beta [Melioribacteraceae bacterium]|nr:phenylalanine--tRNA ligase subunit beta [Melioribacteraceae bacterium]
MKVSLNWLNDYIDIKNIPATEIAEKLSKCGLEVEELVDNNAKYNNIVVGYVKECAKHPNADKLSVCIVTNGKEDFTVVCGAPNVAAGQKVAFAKIGAIIPNGNFEIKKAKIRGQESFGMICAEDELGLSDDHSGIMVLSEDSVLDMPIAEALGIGDVEIEISITPNRSDALSHFGVARDLASLYNLEFKKPKFEIPECGKKTSDVAHVIIQDEDLCPRYVAKVVEGITIKESPDWLKRRLKAVGLRPINNVVDVTNYILYEIGQPLHAFDLKMLEEKTIIVRRAGNINKIVTLDSKERNLLPNDLLICDKGKPVAVAGVMGGENSEVTLTTTDVLIESAYFNPSSIRKTSKKLGLSSDSSYRFERGCDPNITRYAAERAAYLIQQVAGGTILDGVIDVYPNKIEPKSTFLRYERLNKVLGFNIEKERADSILTKLGFNILEKSDDKITVEIPTFRPDVEREIDLIEEVGRIYGYDNIPTIEKISVILDEKIDQSAYNDELRTLMCGAGFYEIVTNSLLNETTANKFGKAIKMFNPLSAEMSHLRPTLLPGGLMTVSNNLKVRQKNLKLFEIGHVFERLHDGELKEFSDFTEYDKLNLLITGKSLDSVWYSKDKNYDIFDLKGYVKQIFSKISLDIFKNDLYYFTNEINWEYGFKIEVNGKVLGIGGKVKKEILHMFEIDQELFSFELNLDFIKNINKKGRNFKELNKFPSVFRDFAFVLEKNIEYIAIIETIFKGSSKLLRDVKLFDIFESDTLGENKRSLAFQLEYYNEERTLTEEEVEKDFWKTIEFVKKEFNAELRGK